MSEMDPGAGEPRRRDILLTVGVSLVAVGIGATVFALLGGEPVGAGLVMIVVGAALWRWRYSKLG